MTASRSNCSNETILESERIFEWSANNIESCMVVAVNEMTRYAEVGRVDDEKGERSLPTTGIEGKKIE